MPLPILIDIYPTIRTRTSHILQVGLDPELEVATNAAEEPAPDEMALSRDLTNTVGATSTGRIGYRLD